MPKFFYPDDQSWEGYHYSLTGSEVTQTLYSGGYTSKDGGTSFIMAVDLASHRALWRKFFESQDGLMDTITAMALNPDGDELAVHGSQRNNEAYSNLSYLFIVRANDGNHLTDIKLVTLGSAGIAEHVVRDQGFVYTSTNKIYLSYL